MQPATRESLLSIVDDMELICRELLENLIAPKPKRLSAQDHEELTKLLIHKDAALRNVLELAGEQGKIERKIRKVVDEIQVQDNCIKQLQKEFKDAENLLSTSIFQAKQKLEAISKSKETPVSSEEIIKYGHRISASNAVCAPLNWQQGDARRPYPTDLEMRHGFLGRPETATAAPPTSALPPQPSHIRTPGGSSIHQHPGAAGSMTPDFHSMSSPSHFGGSSHHSPTKMPGPIPPQQQSGGQFSWQSGEIGMMKDGSHLPMETNKNSQDQDVEVMSTDSSSSSSTDSN